MLTLRVVPAGIAAALFQASIYDVPGGYRAVMFDRFSGVKDKVHPGGVIPPTFSCKHLRAGYTGGYTLPSPMASTRYPL